ncbi:hypothetical protein J7H88_003577 [Vibrio parahaemolyticus]|nr:hypothetical protein [Vibrio parahaemolyticus]
MTVTVWTIHQTVTNPSHTKDGCLGGALDCEQSFDALLLNVLGESVEQ